MNLPRFASGLPWLAELRDAGAARFAEAGLPTQRQEAWKYTGLNRLKGFGFEPTPAADSCDAAIPEPLIAGDCHRLVFVDGRFRASLSRVGALPDGVVLGSLAHLLQTRSDLLEPLIGRLADVKRRPMAALNAAWIEDGLVLIVPAGIVIAAPIEAVFLQTDGAPRTAYPRSAIALGANAAAALVERHEGTGAGFSNAVTEIALAQGAALGHYVLHGEAARTISVETVAADVARDARYCAFALIAGGALVRRDIEVTLSGPGAQAQVDGAYLVDGDRHADTTILIDHQARRCTSRQTQKGVIDGSGRAVYQGKILVRPDAQKTDGHQLSQTLLLSPDAEMDAKPELEIHADDVKCSHGATVGRLDAEALFFLRARGIPEAEARSLLIEGFIGSALDEIDHIPVRDALKDAAARWLAVHAAAEATS
jgi:Fe-S cluster assembly protein SufD